MIDTIYFFEKIGNENVGIYQDFIDCVYILTMNNALKRKEAFLKELQKIHLHSNTIDVTNCGYKDCNKKLILQKEITVKNSVQDLAHAEENKYENILILEDDFRFISKILLLRNP